MKMDKSSPKEKKTLWEKEKLLVIKGLILQTCKNNKGLVWESVTAILHPENFPK